LFFHKTLCLDFLILEIGGAKPFLPEGPFIGLAQRCGGVAAGQTQPPEAVQGRADLRAPQHSGGRPTIKGGRGPKKSSLTRKILISERFIGIN